MANILIFRDDEIAGEYDSGYVSKWNTELANAFEKLGHNVIWFSFKEENLINRMAEVFKQKIEFAFAFNWVYANILSLRVNHKNVLDHFNIPLVSWFWDGICTPTNPAMKFSGVDHLIVACMNEDETDEIITLAPHIKQAFCLPLSGGTSARGGGGY